MNEITPIKGDGEAHPFLSPNDEFADYETWKMAASGYAAVWAEENTRQAIFDAMERKEVYGTTGSRIVLRFFGGWEFDTTDAQSRLPGDIGYAKGVRMGGDLSDPPQTGAAPNFLVAALKVPYSGNFDRIQIVKGWLDANGETQERAYTSPIWYTSGQEPAVTGAAAKHTNPGAS